MSLSWITLTNGRRDLISQSRNSWYEKIDGKVDREIIVDDSGDHEYQQWLKDTYPSAEVIPVADTPQGFTEAVAKCFEIAISTGSEYILHTEDDFILNYTLSISDIISILESNPKLTQVALQRQIWFEVEKIAPTLIQALMHGNEDRFEKKNFNGMDYMENTWCYTTNPHIYPISTAKMGWVKENGSEAKFGDKLFSIGLKASFYGNEYKDEYVTHIGHYRLGAGY